MRIDGPALLAAAWLCAPATLALPAQDPVPGGIAVVPVPGESRPDVWFGEERVLVTGAPGRWQAVVGIPLDTAPGPGALTVEDGQSRQVRSFRIIARDYPVQHVTIQDQRKVDPLPADLARIERETGLMNEARARWTDVPDPPLAFSIPVPGRISPSFGSRRVFNGQPRQPHGGMDIAAPRGTKVVAPAPGTVVLVGDYFFNGRTVLIDHGQRLVSMYCHLDSVVATQGMSLEAGSVIGTVGQTGRASGPHLHFGVYLNGAAVNPGLLLEESTSR